MRVLLTGPLLALCLAAAAAPDPSPSPSSLPEIGRTRATTPACAALRDLVVPAFTAARRADARFDETRKRLARYASFSTDSVRSHLQRRDVDANPDDGPAFRESELHHISADAARLLQESATIGKLLADPRLAADSKDPQVLTERAQLIALYDAQQTRAAALEQFVQRESTTMGIDRVGIGPLSGIAPKTAVAPKEGPIVVKGEDDKGDPAPQIKTPATAPPGMPSRLGYEAGDRNALGTWSDRLAAYVRGTENDAAKTFLLIGQNCR